MDVIIQNLTDKTALWLPKLIGVILILLLFIIFAKLIKKLIKSAAGRLNIDNNIALLLARTSTITLTIFGLITGLGTLGIDVSAMVAGLGLTGFALGFALKDTISNLLSGVLILLYHPFRIGDRIRIAGYEGKVLSIDLRYTEIDAEGDKVLIPNSKLFTDPIRVIKTAKED